MTAEELLEVSELQRDALIAARQSDARHLSDVTALADDLRRGRDALRAELALTNKAALAWQRERDEARQQRDALADRLKAMETAVLRWTMRRYQTGQHGEVIVPDPDGFREDIRTAATEIRATRAALAKAGRP